MSIFVRARFAVHDGREAEFEEIARTLRDRAKNEHGIITYRFFSAGDGGYLVLEEYADSADAILHQENARELLARVRECADMTDIEFYGPIWPELQEWVTSVDHATWYPESGE